MTDIYEFVDIRNYKNPFSLSFLFKRVCWGFVQQTFFRCSFQFLYGWRRFLLRLFGAKIEKGVHVSNTCRLMAPWNLEMGHTSCLGPYTIVENAGKVTIGQMSTISQYSYICTGTHDYTKKENPLVIKPVTVGKGVWVCANSFLAPGVNIGDLAVIGACSAVFKDMPENMVCSGNPCVPLKKRFENASAEDVND